MILRNFLSSRIVTALLISFVWAGISAGIFWYLSSGVREIGAELETIELQIVRLEKERASAVLSAELAKRRPADITRIRAFFVNRERPVAFIEALEGLARDTGVEILLNAEERASRPGFLAFRIGLKGAKEGLLTHLRLMELMPYKISVEDVVFREDLAGSELILLFQVKTQ